MSHAKGYFEYKEINSRLKLSNIDDLWDLLEGEEFQAIQPSWNLKSGENLVFRGQSNASHGISSKLYRDLREGLRSIDGSSQLRV